MAFVHRKLRENQRHIGERSVILLKDLVITALESAIKQACGLFPNIQQTVQEQCVILMKQFGLKISFPEGEIEWQQVLSQVFEGFGFHHNYTIGSYRADFFVKDLRLVLECNGYDNHQYYDQQQEKLREQLLKQNYSILRFHHKITPEKLFNGILQAKMGKVIKLYDIEYPKTFQAVR